MTEVDSLSGWNLDEAVAQELFGWPFAEAFKAPRYHESWDAMRLVVEEMQRRGFYFDLCNHTEGRFVAWFDNDTLRGAAEAIGDSLPTACARAALKAVRQGNSSGAARGGGR